MRFRNVYMIIGGIVALALNLLIDPEIALIKDLPFGAYITATLISLLKTIWLVGLLHFSTKALFDYIDRQNVFDEAMKNPIGAGLIFVGGGVYALGVVELIKASLVM